MLVLLLLAGCASKKNKTKTTTTESVGDVVVLPERKEPSDTVPYVLPDSLLNSSLYTYKDEYNIAVILPLYLDSFQTAATEDTLTFEQKIVTRDDLYPPATMALEFFQGVKVALDSLKATGLKAKVHVFDSYDDLAVRRLISSNELLQMDLIIGPIYNSHVKLLAPYIQKNKIPMVSPLSPAGDLTEKNPSFLMANPRFEVHSENMFQLVADSFAQDNLILIFQSNDVEMGYARSFREMAQQHKAGLVDAMLDGGQSGGNPVVFHEVSISKNEKRHLPDIDRRDLETYLEKGKNNVFVIPSVDLSLVLNLSKELFYLSEDYEISVVGTPIWNRDDELRLDYVAPLNVHFTAPIYLDSVYYNSQFRLNMIEAFGFEPSINTLKGYDITRYLGSMIINYGINFIDVLQIDEQAGWHTNFKFRPAYGSVSPAGAQNLLYLENKYVHILKYQDYKLVKLN